MISSIHIRGFKTLLDATLDLGVVNVFIGANGSGKSNILEALGVLSAASSSTVTDESLLRRGVRPGLPTIYKSSFKSKRMPPEIRLEAVADDAVRYKVSLHNPIERPTTAWQFKSESMNIEGRELFTGGVKTWRNREVGLAATSLVHSELNSPEVRFLRMLQGYAIYTPNTPTLRGLLPDSVRGAIGLQGGGLAEAVARVLDLEGENEKAYAEEALELLDWVSEASVSTSAKLLLSPSVARPRKLLVFEDRFMKSGRDKLAAYDASEGALYVLLALVLARSPETLPLFAVDNFDQALNPRLVKELVRLFCRWMVQPSVQHRQALLTVHNPLVLDGLPINDDRIRLFAIDRDNDGVTRIKRVVVDQKLLATAKENDWPLSRLWIQGHLGGVPNV